MLRGEEPNKGACFVHRIKTGWDPSKFEILSDDGCDLMQFDTTGTLLAVLGKNSSTISNLRPTYLSIWDFTISPRYVNHVEIPRKLRPSNTCCKGLVWSHRGDRIAMTFIKKSYRRQAKVKDTPTDLLIIDSKMCTISRIFQLPFIAICFAFLPSSSDRLLVSDGSGCMMSVVDIKEGTVTEILTQIHFYVAEYVLSAPPVTFDVVNDQFECSLAVDADQKLEKWTNAHPEYGDLPFIDASSFIIVSADIASKFESEFSVFIHGFLLSIQDDKEMGCAMSIKKHSFSDDTGLPDSATQQFHFAEKCFTDTVYGVYVDDENYTVMLISSANSVVLSLQDLSLIWSLQDTLINTIHTDIILLGGGFTPEIRAVIQREDGVANKEPSWSLIVAFSSKHDFGFAIIMQIIDLYNPEGPKIVEELKIPKHFGLSHLECCKHIAVVLGQSSGDELFFLKKSLSTDFAGSMYPSGFKIMKTVRAYIEKEDELDKIVHNENMMEGMTRVVSESFMKNAQFGDCEGGSLQENSMTALPICTVVGDANVERRKAVNEDMEVDIFTKYTDSGTPSPESVMDIPDNSRPRTSWTTEDFNYFVPNGGSASLGPVPTQPKKNKSEYSTSISSTISDAIRNTSDTAERSSSLTHGISSSSVPDVASNAIEGKLCIDHLLPIPMSIRGGHFVAKIVKEKKLADDIEKNRMRKTLIDDKIANFEKLYKDETVKRKERDLIRREKAKEMEEKRRLQKIETNKRRLEKRREEREKRQKYREDLLKHNENAPSALPIATANSSSSFNVPDNSLVVGNDFLKPIHTDSLQVPSLSHSNNLLDVSAQPHIIVGSEVDGNMGENDTRDEIVRDKSIAERMECEQ